VPRVEGAEVEEWEPVGGDPPAPALLVRLLGLVSPESVRRMVEEGRDVSIPKLVQPLVARAAAEMIVSWLRGERPELAEVLGTEKGKRWLTRQILRAFGWR
jgi:hypothetical protein